MKRFCGICGKWVDSVCYLEKLPSYTYRDIPIIACENMPKDSITGFNMEYDLRNDPEFHPVTFPESPDDKDSYFSAIAKEVDEKYLSESRRKKHASLFYVVAILVLIAQLLTMICFSRADDTVCSPSGSSKCRLNLTSRVAPRITRTEHGWVLRTGPGDRVALPDSGALGGYTAPTHESHLGSSITRGAFLGDENTLNQLERVYEDEKPDGYGY